MRGFCWAPSELFEHGLKAGLLEVMVGGQCRPEAELLRSRCIHHARRFFSVAQAFMPGKSNARPPVSLPRAQRALLQPAMRRAATTLAVTGDVRWPSETAGINAWATEKGKLLKLLMATVTLGIRSHSDENVDACRQTLRSFLRMPVKIMVEVDAGVRRQVLGHAGVLQNCRHCRLSFGVRCWRRFLAC